MCAMAFRTNVMFLKTFLVFYGPMRFNNLDGTIPNHLKFIFKYKHDLCIRKNKGCQNVLTNLR